MSPALNLPEMPEDNLTGHIAEVSNILNVLSSCDKLDYQYM